MNKKINYIILVLIFVASGILGVVSESTYDIAFGNTALGISDKIFWVGVIYFVGYITEAFAAATMGVHIDRWGALRSVFVFSVIACLVLILSGSLNVYAGINSIIFVVLVAGIMDFLNQLVNIAQTAAIPQAFGDDKNRLLTFSGLDSSVRAITGLVAPVIAGFIVSGFAELSSLFIVGLFYGTSAILLIMFLKSVRSFNFSNSSADSDEGDSKGFYQGMSSGRIIQITFLEIWQSVSWRKFLIVDILATAGLSTVLLLLFSLLKMEYRWEPEQIGFALAFMALGSLTASVLIARNNIDNLKYLFGFGALTTGVGSLLLSISGGYFLIVYPGALIIGFGSVLQMKAMTLIVQVHAPQARIGAWFSVIDGIERVINALAIIGSAILMDLVGGFVVFSVLSFLLIGCGLWWSFYSSNIILKK